MRRTQEEERQRRIGWWLLGASVGSYLAIVAVLVPLGKVEAAVVGLGLGSIWMAVGLPLGIAGGVLLWRTRLRRRPRSRRT